MSSRALVLLSRAISTDQYIECVCIYMHMPFVYMERVYLELGLRGGMWNFIKSTDFFHMSYPVGFAIEWFFGLS